MKMSFAVVLAMLVNAILVTAQQECVSPMSNTTSLPSECQDSVMTVARIIANITEPEFTDIDSKLGNFCMSQCIGPFVDYYTCLGEIEYANILDGLLCGQFNNQSCLQLWSDVFNLNGSNPDGISYLFITQNCRNPLMCNDVCSTELNKAVELLGCCLAGIVEFNLCGPLEKLRFEECSIQIPQICAGVGDTPTTPSPVIPTVGTNCVHPSNDTNYPAECNDALIAVESIAITVSSEGLASLVDALPTDTVAVLDGFCTRECVGPLVDYYSCTGEPGYANALNGFFCGRGDADYCLEELPLKLQTPGGINIQDLITINTQCNDVLECNEACNTALSKARNTFGCCLAGAVEFMICGTLEQTRFDECGIDVGSVCEGIDLTRATDRPTMGTTEPTRGTDGSGGVTIVPFSLVTLLGIVAFAIAKLA